jgi:aryl-alcohol dehydrogenase-like predicted oxidoreductase
MSFGLKLTEQSELMPATPSGTRSYFERLKTQGLSTPSSSLLGSTELTVSRVGFGGYRINEFDPDHREALREALLSGVNLIDTSANYGDGSSEKLVGEVTAELIEKSLLKREEFVVVTKAGYVQGQNLKRAKTRIANGAAFPDMVEYQTDVWHNISPEFLEDQITQSLERMKIDCIDVLLLHNPEYFLKTSTNREMYYKRIDKAFRYLEKECERGRIRYYGVSSNTFPEAESRSDFTNLARVFDIANAISKPNRFAVAQFPFNIFEAGAALHLNTNRDTVLNFADRHKLGILTNRPFNAYAKGRLVRLTSFPTHDEVEVKGGLHTVLGRAIELEKRAPGYPKSPQGLQWAHALRDKLSEIDDLLTWRDVLYNQIFPSIRQGLARMTPEQNAWAQDYQTAMQELLRLVTHDLENLAEKKAQLMAEQVTLVAPALSESRTFSQKVLRLYQSFPQVSSVLIGMRTPNYVRDVIATAPPLKMEEAHEALQRLQRYRS